MLIDCATCSKTNRVPAKRLGDRAKCASCKSPLLPIARPVPIASADDFDELLRHSTVPVLVDFWASWCGPCRAVAPELEKVARGHGGSLVVAKLDTEALPVVAGRYNIRSIPTMIVFRNGREEKRISGAMPAAAIESQLGI